MLAVVPVALAVSAGPVALFAFVFAFVSSSPSSCPFCGACGAGCCCGACCGACWFCGACCTCTCRPHNSAPPVLASYVSLKCPLNSERAISAIELDWAAGALSSIIMRATYPCDNWTHQPRFQQRNEINKGITAASANASLFRFFIFRSAARNLIFPSHRCIFN